MERPSYKYVINWWSSTNVSGSLQWIMSLFSYSQECDRFIALNLDEIQFETSEKNRWTTLPQFIRSSSDCTLEIKSRRFISIGSWYLFPFTMVLKWRDIVKNLESQLQTKILTLWFGSRMKKLRPSLSSIPNLKKEGNMRTIEGFFQCNL